MSPLPEGWDEASLAELAGPDGLITDGDWVESKDQDPNGGIRLIQLADIGDGIFLNKSARFLNTETAERLRCTFLQKGDLLVARMPDPLGRACIFPGVGQPAVTAVDVFIWRPDSFGANSRWLMFFINSPEIRAAIQSEAGGTTRQRVAGGKLKQLRLPVPPLAEQRRIAAKLDSLTGATARARAELNRLPNLIGHYKQAVLSAAFSGGLTAGWSIRGDAPVVTLDEVAKDFSYGTSAKSSKEGEVPVLRMGNIQGGKLQWDDLAFTSNPAEIDKYALAPGDVLFNRTNSPELVGKTAVFRGERKAIFAGYLIRVRCSEKLLPDYLSHCLNSPEGRRYCWEVKTDGVSQSNINAKKLAAFSFRLPSITEQREINRKVDTAFGWLDRVAHEHENATRLLPRLDQAILATAFRGDLMAQDPNEEPASLMLDRVRAAREQTPKRGRQVRVRGTGTVTISGNGSLGADQKEHDMNKTRKDVSPTHLCDIVKKSGGQIKADALWRASEMQIDEFYKLFYGTMWQRSA